MTTAACAELEPLVGISRSCALTGRSRATRYRRQAGPLYGPPKPRPTPPNALGEAERAEVLAVLRSAKYRDLAVAQVWALLLDDGTYLCSRSTMHRILRDVGEAGDRRRQRTHPANKKPHLVAYGPNEVWSWDISKLPGPARSVYYSLYAVIDIFSRYIVAWCVATREDAELAKELIGDAVELHGIAPGQLSVHADRGSAMTSKSVSQLLIDLGVARTHSRPHTSDDNPYIEAVFKTLKYCPAWPGHFGSIQDARSWCDQFVAYYNHVHRHGALGLHTPASVHYGTAVEIRAMRADVLDAAYTANPARFRHRRPQPPALPTVAWINDPDKPLTQSA